jgi:hypothetical protein
MIGETIVLFLSLTSALVLLIILLAVYRIYRVNQKIAAEIGIESDGFFNFNLNNSTMLSANPQNYLIALIYLVIALSIAALLFALTALAEGSSEVAAYLFGISLFAMAVSGYCITQNSKTTQTVKSRAPKPEQNLPVEELNIDTAAKKQDLPKSQGTEFYTFCSSCGYRNESDAIFCRGCGKKIV